MTSREDARDTSWKDRPALARLAAAALIGALVYGLHDPLETGLTQAFGLDASAIDTLTTLLALFAFAWLQHSISGSRTTTPDQTRTAPADEHGAADALNELSRFHVLLIQQLHSVVGNTEQAALAISQQLQAASALVGKNDSELAHRLDDAVTHLQFQDITRQQIEQIIFGIELLDRHAKTISGQSGQSGRVDNNATEESATSLEQQIEHFYARYVMEQQREIHHQVLGRPAQAPGSSAPESSADKRNIELF